MDFLQAEIAKKRKQVEELTVEKKKKFFKRSELYGESPTTSDCEDEPQKDENNEISFDEVCNRLRYFKEPIKFFGETESDIRKRLIEIEKNGLEVPETIKKKSSFEVIKTSDNLNNEDDDKKYNVIYNEGKDLKWEDIEEEAKLLGENDVTDCKVIADFIRSYEEKSSTEGRFQASMHKETVTHVKPLLKDVDNRSIKSSIRQHLAVICRYVIVEKDQIKANNAYMEMAIGNAPWPVGVTRSGIHQRPSSSRMYVSNIAHVLNDEKQRKYIQGLKRLITKQFKNN
ncbi:LD21120p [Strongyloides ratti]|uniref:Pre-mRNA-splicing factor 18 n=1 Tax=Strongyloides ratti TaxID=34506 RepID=A0A090LQ93_STRRB|nr:LD21120p [Strongyloides ratti]CEF69706.1 LD21120p [Strongyloides ratti]